MGKKRASRPKPQPTLRERAEAVLHASRKQLARMSREQIQKVVHELEVHQVELRMQNEELREAQIHLAQSRDRFNALYDFAPVGYLTLDKASTVLEANLTLATMIGVERRKLIGSKLTHFIAPAAQDTLYHHLRAVFAGEEKQTCELLVRTTGGATFFARVESIGVRDPGASAIHCWSAISDITARKQAEDALARSHAELEQRVAERTQSLSESEERLRCVSDNASVGLTRCSRNLRYLSANPAYAEIAGLPLEKIVGRSIKEVMGAAALETIRPYFERALRGEHVVYEAEVPFAAGGKRYLHVSYTPERNPAGQVAGWVACVTDITARKQVENALRESEERYRALVQASSDVVYRMSADWKEMRHLDGREFIADTRVPSGGWLQKYIFPDDQKHVMAVIEEAIRTKGVFELEHRVRRVDGSVGWTFSRAVPILDAGGKIVEWFGMATDVTERKRLEIEVLQASEGERQRVAADLHDGICQELISISFVASAVQRDLEPVSRPLAAKVRKIASAISRAAGHTRAVARGMNPVVADGEALMHTLRQLAAEATRTRRVRCVFECRVPVRVEDTIVANQLYRIAQEAVHNAIHHGSARRITVRLSESDDEFCLAILDNGRGLPAHASHGAGMGLRAMKYRASLIRGHLTVEGRRRGGTEVVCRIPKAPVRP